MCFIFSNDFDPVVEFTIFYMFYFVNYLKVTNYFNILTVENIVIKYISKQFLFLFQDILYI